MFSGIIRNAKTETQTNTELLLSRVADPHETNKPQLRPAQIHFPVLASIHGRRVDGALSMSMTNGSSFVLNNQSPAGRGLGG